MNYRDEEKQATILNAAQGPDIDRYMTEILPILRKTLSNQSINQSINQHSRSIVSQGTSGSFHKNFYEQFWSFKRKHKIRLLFTKKLTSILVCKSVVKVVRSLFKLDVSTYNKNDKSQTNKQTKQIQAYPLNIWWLSYNTQIQ